ncbi:PREDICTED: carbonic anhydrase 15-like [Gavialis gangeticus]|uniref:carbonic anhydrase 15-like n=1 Tax=Gavialis gangeticus TaxID=94835 RepID=UPI00092F44C6|nr:PREDICTED: carbonic anhydrase 15-like [Gavialis gangeticus]
MRTQGLGLTFITLPLVIRAATGGQWCYDSQDPKCGPGHWKDFKATCGGDNQSPINIDRHRLLRDSNLGDILFEGYDQAPPGKWRLTNDGHTVMMILEGESIMEHINITSGGLPDKYRALQFHFHWGSLTGNGSEHTIDGHQYPMEMHIVHMNVKYKSITEAKGHPNGLAVLSFLFKASDTDNSNYNTIVAGLKNISREGDFVDLSSTFCLDNLLPDTAQLSKYYRYKGSLTTPDCSEVVIWTVFEEPILISQSQLNAFVTTVHFPAAGSTLLKMTNNFRSPQPLKNRKVYASRDATVSHSPKCSPSIHFLLPPLLALLIDRFSGPS